jgi:hypothetical protein
MTATIEAFTMPMPTTASTASTAMCERCGWARAPESQALVSEAGI